MPRSGLRRPSGFISPVDDRGRRVRLRPTRGIPARSRPPPRRSCSRSPRHAAKIPPESPPSPMAPWVRPRRLSLMFSTWTTATGMPTISAADSTRLNSASTSMAERNTGRSRRMNRQHSPRSRRTVDSTFPSAARGRWGMWMNSSMTAERKKQPAPTHRMGRRPKTPNSTPPATGPRRPDRVCTILMTALALVSRSAAVRRGMLACTAG